MSNRLQIENKMDTMNDYLRKISLAIGGEVEKPSTWEEIRILCRNNKIRGLLEIGEAIPFKWNGAVYNAIVMDFIEEGQHSSGLQLRDGLQTGVIFQTEKILESLQFDEKEAFYSPSADMAVGTYNFVLKEHSWYAPDVNKTFQFTLPQVAPKGSHFVFQQAYNATLNNATVNVYADGKSSSKLFSVTLTEGSEGTALGELKNSKNENFNSCQRALFGNNNWKESALRQHLNSDSDAVGYWTPQNVWDRYPSWNGTAKGFISGLEKDLKDNIAKVTRHTYRNTVSDGGGIDETTDTIFLPSRKELYMPVEGADDTEPFAFYAEGSQYAAPNVSADPIRVKSDSTGTAKYWWMQSPSVGGASGVRVVFTTGAVDVGNACYSIGVAPAFVIA